MEHTHKVRFENRRGKAETIPAYSLRQARAIGLSWSKTGSFRIDDMNGRLVDLYEDGKPVRL